MRKLTIATGVARGAEIPLRRAIVTIGRENDNVITLDDHDVSRHHAQLLFDGREYLVRDLGSSNGTFINHHRITEARLSIGDRLGVGGVEFSYAEYAGLPGVPNIEPAVAVPTAPAPRLFMQLPAPAAGPSPPVAPAAETNAAAEDLARLSRELERSKAELANVQLQLAASAKTAEQAAAMRQKNDELASQLRVAKQETTAESSHRQTIAAELATVRDEVAKLTRAAAQAEAKRNEQAAAQTATAAELAAAQTRSGALTQQLATAVNELATLRRELDQARPGTARAGELALQKQQLETQLAAVQQSLGAAKQESADAQAELRRMQAAAADANEQIARTAIAAAEFTTLHSENAALLARLTATERAVTEAQRKAAELLAVETAQHQAELAAVGRELEAAKKIAARVPELAVQAEKLTQQLAAETARREAEAAAAARELAAARKIAAGVPELTAQVGNLTQQLAVAKSQVTGVAEQTAAAQQQVATETAAVKQTNAELTQRVAEAEQRLEQSRGQLQRTAKELEAARTELQKIARTVDWWQTQNKTLQADLLEAQDENEEFSKQITTRDAEVVRLATELRTVRTELDAVQRERTELAQKFAAAQEKFDALSGLLSQFMEQPKAPAPPAPAQADTDGAAPAMKRPPVKLVVVPRADPAAAEKSGAAASDKNSGEPRRRWFRRGA